MSDASDIDARLRMLNDELQRRKREADELKREERRSKRQEEVSLKKQIKVSATPRLRLVAGHVLCVF